MLYVIHRSAFLHDFFFSLNTAAVLCPEAPVIGRVTHNSIQMAWVPPDPARRRSSSVTFMNLLFQTTSPHRRTDMTFCVEQKNLDCREEGYKKVYE